MAAPHPQGSVTDCLEVRWHGVFAPDSPTAALCSFHWTLMWKEDFGESS